VEFGAHHADVETDVVARQVGGFFEHLVQLAQHKGQRHPFGLRPFGGDFVHLGRVKRNGITLGLHNEVLHIYQGPRRVVQLPGQLHHAGPVVAVGNGGVVIAGQTRGFGVKNEVHGQKRDVAKIAKSWVLEAGYLSTG